ncbi:uncharacterized protein LOC121649364 isoform X2 [Melanotaenia boesemani]|uniref:uncharacterized protein LOC121649364 isoform X2 n=1 Tax=Melanotaenia boesemani TaxID=1250792 RepID=UPI001C043ED8|nr:uncharacterized protein LOC121649364 isoform X2 [Melanotaenia boesemani]
MVDSGATHSVLKTGTLNPTPPLSGKTVISVSAGGHHDKEKFTVPLTCSVQGEHPFTHSFLLSKVCPVNLLGRDLMCKLGIQISSGSQGLTISCSSSDTEEKDLMMVKYNPRAPCYAYQWKMGSSPLSSHWLSLCRARVSPGAEVMGERELHCTSYICPDGPDQQYEKIFFRDCSDKLTVTCMFWNESMCVLSVSLTSDQQKLFKLHTHPHVSLSKSHSTEWKDLGPFVATALRESQWQSTHDSAVLFSPRLGVFKQSMLSVIHCQKSVQLVDDDFLTCLSADSPLPPVPPSLSQVPSDLWATSPHDVGLVKNCPPVVITPKSDYRPCQKQYPLKPEALEVLSQVQSVVKEALPRPASDLLHSLVPGDWILVRETRRKHWRSKR